MEVLKIFLEIKTPDIYTIGDKVKTDTRHKFAGCGLSVLVSTEIIMLMWESRHMLKKWSIP